MKQSSTASLAASGAPAVGPTSSRQGASIHPALTQHESHNLAGDPQKAFKCLFFKVVSKAGEKLSEIRNEGFNSESAKR